jgi:hypothetical protein
LSDDRPASTSRFSNGKYVTLNNDKPACLSKATIAALAKAGG